MKRLGTLIAALVLTSTLDPVLIAHAQSPVSVIGPITVGNCAQFSSNTVIKDAGVVCAGGGSSGIIIGTTTITGGVSGQFLYDNAGVVGTAALGTMSTQNASGVAITGGTITGLGLPSVASDAANKQYVDNSIVGLIVHSQALLATATALPANTYNNGSSGVGATLTGNSNGALTIDGVLTTASARVVVKNEAAAANNGIYAVTTVGTGGTPYVLTRATDANTPGTSNPAEIGFGTYVFVTSGTANAQTGWSVTSTVTTIGTSAINWAQFSVTGGGGGGSNHGVAYATCANTAGDGAIIQTAVNTTLPVIIVGPCVLDSSITISTPQQPIGGYGPSVPLLTQSSILATGSFICATGDSGPYFHDMQINFVQPNTSTRASLTQYNPVFFCRDTPRVRFDHIRIQAAMVGFDLQGNSGGAYLNNIEISAYNAGVILDGSLDTVRITNSHFWPFGITTNNTFNIYRQHGTPAAGGGYICNTFTGTVGICVGRMDDLILSNVLFISGGPQLYGAPGTGGPGGTSWDAGNAIIVGSNNDFDTNNGIYWFQGGSINFSSTFFSEVAGAFAVAMEAGNGLFSCSGCNFFSSGGSTPTIENNSGSAIISGSILQSLGGSDWIFAYLCDSACTGPSLSLTGNIIYTNPAVTYSTVVIAAGGTNIITSVGNSIINTPASASIFVASASTIRNSTANACPVGWTGCM